MFSRGKLNLSQGVIIFQICVAVCVEVNMGHYFSDRALKIKEGNEEVSSFRSGYHVIINI